MGQYAGDYGGCRKRALPTPPPPLSRRRAKVQEVPGTGSAGLRGPRASFGGAWAQPSRARRRAGQVQEALALLEEATKSVMTEASDGLSALHKVWVMDCGLRAGCNMDCGLRAQDSIEEAGWPSCTHSTPRREAVRA